VEGGHSRLSYIEVLPAQHFDTFIAFGGLLGFDTRYVPLHVYFNRAMDAVWAHLKSGAALPPSQVVRATPRLAGVPLADTNVPHWSAHPAPTEAIVVAPHEIRVPQ
jgi:hydroxybutyrate-dimer hydrolase